MRHLHAMPTISMLPNYTALSLIPFLCMVDTSPAQITAPIITVAILEAPVQHDLPSVQVEGRTGEEWVWKM
jgi:hypothetical protein